jgi:hypothetical protein
MTNEDYVVDLGAQGSIEIDPEDGVIRGFDAEGTCQDRWEPCGVGYGKVKRKHFPDFELPCMEVLVLDCPFCGGVSAVSVVDHNRGQYRPLCLTCGVTTSGWQATPEESAAVWNRRRVTGLVNWLEAEIKKFADSDSTLESHGIQSGMLRRCRKMVRKLLGQ